MSKYAMMGMIGFFLGMEYKKYGKKFCLARMKKQAARMLRMI